MMHPVLPAGGRQASPESLPAPASAPGPGGLRAWVAPLLLSLATGLLLYASYFPLAWGWLGWLALVPFLWLVKIPTSTRRLRTAWLYVSAWLGGLLFIGGALWWMTVADYRMFYTWGMLAVYCSLYFPLGLYLLRRLDRTTRFPMVVTVPVVWTALECFRANFGTGFAWYLLGYTQQTNLPAIQIADLGGVYAVSFVVAAVNALGFELVYRLWKAPAGRRWRGFGVQAVAVGVLAAATFGYGFWRLGQNDTTPGPTLALLQGNIDQRIRNEATANAYDAVRQVFYHYLPLSDKAAVGTPRPDLVVWPETSYPIEWTEDSYGRLSSQAQGLAYQLWRRDRLDMLVGLNMRVDPDGARRRYNSAVLLGKGGAYQGQYDKTHLVPFGEYVPLRNLLPLMNQFAPYDFDYSLWPGEHHTRFPLKDWHFGVSICFDDEDPELCRHYGAAEADGPPVDFLINISNDGWFVRADDWRRNWLDGSSEHDEHLALCRFRAIECRRALARAVNMGTSAVIDGSGRILALPGPSLADSKFIQALLVAEVPIDHRTSLYALWGDWLPGLCGLLLVIGWITSVYWPLSQGGTGSA